MSCLWKSVSIGTWHIIKNNNYNNFDVRTSLNRIQYIIYFSDVAARGCQGIILSKMFYRFDQFVWS